MRVGRRRTTGAGSGARVKLRVVLADDSPIALELIGEALDAAGFSVLKYPTTIGLRAVILREKPAVLVLDVHIPPLDGPTTIRLLREHPQLCDTRVLLYSAEELTKLERIAKDCGADAWSPKEPATIALAAAALVLRGKIKAGSQD